MKVNQAVFATGAASYADCPEPGLDEFAFIGRSNVGKSSLINMLTGKANLAHTSGQPGKTRQINFYRVDDAWMLVDLPGYGFAKAPKSMQREFNVHVSAYLTERPALRQVFLLVDASIEPKAGDLAFADWLQGCEVPYSVVMTKTDRGSRAAVEANMSAIVGGFDDYGLAPTEIFQCSAKTGAGRAGLLGWIGGRIRPAARKKAAKKKRGGIRLDWMKA